ncbi:non-ribosomal peptide synthetase [Amycolatopsis sp. 195334CR]|uniref:non-ribosomal peptide synthetase n=1 Tax=Amycolatopsis sp. 195334CR TaxID=2814588 RepID=UPI001A8DCB54|nr:non-ribosomal peptide synthetase [Amycolatopsis sp. 195334CR]MBN6037279.1 amino acid adenylation domain-containing protein [Amycolatopsis sp. 195334CR]
MRSLDRIETELDLESVPYLRDLELAGVPVVPSAVVLEIAGATAAIAEQGEAMVGVRLPEPVVHTENDTVELVADLYQNSTGAYGVRIHRADWARTVHVEALFAPGSSAEKTADPIPLDDIRRRCGQPVSRDEFYADLTALGISCGAALGCVESAWRGNQEILGAVRSPVSEAESELYRLHPVMLEAALQPAFALLTPWTGSGWYLGGIDRFEIHREGATVAWTHVVRTDTGENLPGAATFHIGLLDADGYVVAELTGVQLRVFGTGELRPPRLEPPSGEEIRALEGDEQRDTIHTALHRWLAQVMRIDADELDTNRKLRSYGIDSFMGMELKALLQRHWEIDIPLTLLFDGRSVETLTEDVVQRFSGHHANRITRRERGEISRLSRGQEALWSIHRFAAESGAYHVATALRVLSPLDLDKLENAWQTVVARHGLLGATFGEDDQGPFYRLGSATDFDCVDARAVNDFERLLADEADLPFVLEDSVPVRLRVYQRPDGESVLLLCAHHIVVDMWSCVVLLEDLALAYGGGTEASVPAVEYADFVDWQRELVASPEGDRLWNYWRERLSGELPVLALPGDRPRPAVQSFRGASRVFGIGRELTERLKELGVRCGVTPFVVLLSAYQLLLHRETGQERVVVGSPISGRGRSELERTVGYFVNPVPLIADFTDQMSFEDTLRQVHEVVLGAFEHEDFPMAEMVERLAPERDSSYSPLYQTMFVMQRSQAFDQEGLAPLAVGAGSRLQVEAIELHSLVVEPVTVPRNWSMFDLTWMVAESDDGFLVSVDYNTDLFDESTVDRFLEHFRVLLDGVAGAPERAVAKVPLLAAAEHDLMVRQWNDTAVDFGAAAAGRVHEGVWAAGACFPDATAVIAHDGSVTYRELLARASRIGWWLREQGARPNELVGVCLEKCTDQVAAVLGVVASGAAYLPLDPGLPQARLAELVDLGAVKQVLTRSGIELPDGVTRLDLDAANLASYPAGLPDVVQAPTDLAYVIFTSGSTGVPKGVMIDHLGVLNTVVDINQRFDVTPDDRVLGLASLSFDLSVYDIFGPLAVGAALVLPAPEGVKDPSHWVELIDRHGVTVWDSVPMLLQLLVEAPEASAQTLASLRIGLLSGDWIPVTLPEKVWALNPEMKLFSGGGATEASIWSITHPITEVDPGWTSIPYGRPLSNQRFYILNSAQEPCPVGVAGELCIGGIGVARGYWRDEERTNASFLPDPFSDDPRALLYRTGDLGRWRKDGVIEFLGRVDHQVKIRGFRVELGEIDSVLSAHPAVAESVTVVHQDGVNRRLASYVVTEADPAELRDWVHSRLPEYMVPAGVTRLDRLPLSSNGKVDRSALPEPVWQAADEFVEARSEQERVLARIWAEVLGVERVGVRDNFFALGGDSILSIQMVSRAAQHGIQLTPAQVFREQTVARLVEVAGQGPVVVADQGPVVGPVELGPVQRWFFGLDLTNRDHWNQTVVLEADGELDAERVAKALETVLDRHDVLRSRFAREDGQWRQEQLAEATAPVVDGDPNRGLDIEHGPLLQAAITGNTVTIACHHLVIDAVSWRFVLEDFERAYLGEGEMPAKTTSYAEWSSRLADYDASDQVEYWRELVDTITPLPADLSGDDTHATAVTRRVLLPAASLVDAGRRMKARPDELVLTAWARALAEWTGRDGVTVDVEAHGREALSDDVDLSRTAGWFTAIRPVHLPVGGTDEIGALRAVKRSLREAPDQGIGYGLLRAQLGRDAPVLFNYLGQIDQAGAVFALRYDPAANDAGYAPENRRHHTFEINAGLHHDQLLIDFTYSSARHEGTTIDGLLDSVQRQLTALTDSTQAAFIPEDFPLTQVTEAELARIATTSIDDLYPATPMQQGLLFHTLSAPDSGVYIEQIRLRLSGELRVSTLCDAWERTVQRHPALRTALAWQDLTTPYQVVHTKVAAPIVIEERDDLDALLREDRTAGFSLSDAPLMRLRLIRADDRSWDLVWSHHHVVLDGWSAALVLEDFFAVYRALVAGEEPSAVTAPPYRDYVEWLAAQDLGTAEEYWRTHLAGFTEPTRLGIEQVIAATARRPEAAESTVELPKELSDRTREFARAHGLTLNTVLMGAWSLLLSRYSGQRDLVFGVTSAGRPAEVSEVERMIGLFINTLPARVGVPAEQRVADWLRDLQRVETERRRYENTPLTKAHEWSDIAGGTPLFDHIFVVENYLLDESVFQVDESLRVSDYRSYEQTNYLLALVVEPLERLTLRTRHDPDRLAADTVERLLGHFEVLLDGVISAPQRPVGEVPLLSAAEREMLVRQWNDTDEDFGAPACVHEGVWAAGARFPDAPAVIAHDGVLTYGELLARASRIGWWLREQGARPNELVGVCLPKGVEQIAAVLGVVASGAAYLPLDPGLPQARLAELIELGGVTRVLTGSGIELPGGVTRLDLDVEKLATYSAEMPDVVQAPTDLAYVIFTSGSTGVPKGVMIDHLGVHNTVVDINRRFEVTPDDRVLGLASLSFDLSVYDIFGPLAVGAALVLPAPDGVKDPSHWVELIERYRVTVWDSVPMLLQLLVEAPEASAEKLASLRVGLLSGDWIPVSLPEKVWALNPGMKIFSGGGATEASIWSISYPITEVDPSWTSIPYGRPLSNQRFYVLNEAQQLCPVGVAGELCIGGIGVARGYWGDEERTNASFLPDPFSDDPRALLYRTGDLGRWRSDGVIEFLGRVDHQVKIRGFRVELGEIDSVLSAHPAVAESVTVVHQEGTNRRLASYVVAENADVTALQEWVRERLPEYMVPAGVTVLDRLPLSSNGKVDRSALPEPEWQSDGEYVEARSATEKALAGVWAEVLGVERVGIHDNFFALGGDSILSIQMVSRAAQAGIHLTPAQVFREQTVARLAEMVGEKRTSIQRRERGAVSRLSRGQEALWSIYRFADESGAYHVATAMRVLSPLDNELLRSAWQTVVSRHSLLGAVFGEDDQGPFFRIDPGAVADFDVVDARAVADLEGLVADEADRPFALDDGAPVRLRVFERDGESVLLICAHHIVVDLWSCVVLLEELALEYRGEASMPPPAVEYADFVDWQRELLSGADGERLWEYWRERLDGDLPVLALPADRPRPAVQSFRGANRVFNVGQEISEGLKELGARLGVTPFVVLLSAYQLFLHRETGQNRIVVGSPTAGRGQPEIDNVVGYFINPLPMLTDFTPDMSFEDTLRQVNEVVLGAFEHEDFPMAEMVERLAPERDSSYSPLYQTMFVMQRTQAFDTEGLAPLAVGAGNRLQVGEGEAIELHSLVVEPATVQRRWSMFDLTWMVAESDDGFLVSVDYNTDLFDESTVDRFLEHFRVLLDGVVAAPERPVGEVPLLTEAERNRLVHEWNDTDEDFGAPACVHEGVWAAGARYPEATAVIAHDGELTYRELLARASRIGWWLREQGALPNELVGICLPKGVNQVAAVLGVVASGAAYLPLDPALPQARLAELIELGGVKHVLTASDVDLPPVGTRLDLDRDQLTGFSSRMPDVVQTPTDLAYVIFTSGSTGVPKGVMIDHLGVHNTVVDINRRFEVMPEDRVLGLASLSFDLSVYDIFGPLAVGAALVLPAPEGVKDPSHWVELVDRHDVTVWDSVPMLLQLLVEAPEADATSLASLRVGLLSGDWIPVSLPEKVWALNPGMKIFSGGGATEASIWSISYPITEVDPSWTSIPYGRPLSNQRFYVLNEAQQLCPVGVAGELCIGGIGVARGYWGDEERTNASFLSDPFSDDPRALLYRTGDLGRWRSDGVIEFLGRVDHQVKIRGFRVELGEIDSALTAHEAVSDAVTVVHGEGTGKRLASYVVTEADPAELRGWVRDRLPEYMVPAGITVLERLPLSSNGKVDRSALPEPVWQAADEFVEARSDQERVLAEIWADVLGLDEVGVLDNFFALGGDSILSIQMVSRAAQHGIHLTPAQVFREQTVARLVEVAGQGPVVVAEQGPVVGPVELGPVQRWFFGLELENPDHWNQGVVLESSIELDPDLVAEALGKVVAHHDVLRSRFVDRAQEQLETDEVPVELIDGSGRDADVVMVDAVRAAHSGLDLENGPLLRAVVVDLDDAQRLVLACHHLVVDAVSWRFIVEDFERAYLDEGDFPPKTTSFAEWTSRLYDHDVSGQADYWRQVASTITPLPVDRAGQDVQASAITRRLTLPADVTAELVENARRTKARTDELVLTACAQGLADWSDRAGITIDVEGHGREPLFDDVDLTRTAGWFTVIRPVHLPVGGAEAAEAVRVVKQALREAPDNGLGYGLLREQLGLPDAPVLFNYLGQVDESATGDSVFRLQLDNPAWASAAQAPENTRHHTLEINAGIHHTELVLDLTYSTERHSDTTAADLLDGIRRRLEVLAGHAEAAAHTSDFPLAGLSQQALDDLVAKMEGNAGA